MMTVVRGGTYRDGDGWWIIQDVDGVVTFYGQMPDGRAFHDEETAIDAVRLGIAVAPRPLVDRPVDIREA